jgi:hypothetical protein
MTCASSADCEEGNACSGGYCVEGVLPPSQCVQAAQRYYVQAGEAFSVIGSQSGYLHHRIVDPATGLCIGDPDGHPLLTGRIPLAAPPCAVDELEVSPNPCSVTVDQVESMSQWNVAGGVCESTGDEVAVREAQAIRFRNPSFTFHLVDPQTAGDAQCNGDRAGTGEPYPTVFPGYRFTFRVVGGHVPGALTMTSDTGTRRLAYPGAITQSPYGSLWVMDQGDRSSSIRGQVLWFEPVSPTAISSLNYIQ